MNDLEIKSKAAQLFKSGRHKEAVKLLMERLQTDSPQAEEMLLGIDTVQDISNKVSCVRSMRDKIFGYLVGPIGIILLISAGILYLKDQEAAKTSIPVSGTVIELKKKETTSIKNGKEEKSETYAVVIEYFVAEKRYLHEPDIYSNPPLFQLNETAPLLVDPTNPEKVIVNSFLGRYITMIALGVFGLILTGIGAYSLLKRG